ncbi:MAG: NAD(P)H-dependent glycerol-3-phosphate dehydrogenase [Candidatus Pelagibacterales bacterium]|jgi:glycerol-3-phosphate dehydrogenase (NAD(P)+)|tara:strand:+ start:1244 stop:2239 length:996 start_codon:yes stop_codon:yes gene_type:complete
MSKKSIGVLGAGAWGTTIAKLLSDKNPTVLLWAREPLVKINIEKFRINKGFLDKIKLSKTLKVTSNLNALNEVDFLFIVVPTQHIEKTLKQLSGVIKQSCILINCSKGIDIKSTALISDIIKKCLPKNKIAIMSGPNFAHDIALGKPTASLIASKKTSDAKTIASLISSKNFRPYLSNDIIGAQICGAMKNVYAIGCGIIVGKNFGENAVASVISRSFAEIKSVGIKLGAKSDTLSGLSGLGDLFLTCSSAKSRNFTLGINLAKGKKLDSLMKSKLTIAEGAYTVKAIKKLATQLKLSLPLNDAIYKILYKNKDINKIIIELLNRPIIKEH